MTSPSKSSPSDSTGLNHVGRLARWVSGYPHGASFAMAQFLFIRFLAVAAFLAFWSLWHQMDGLFGSHGILPIVDFLAAATEWGRETHVSPGVVFPSVLWLSDASDATLRGLCVAGMLAACVLFVGVVPRLAVACLWVLYLSLVSVGQIFLGYQWDALLLEALFVGFFFAPGQVLPKRTMRRSAGGRWLVWLLTFKLMFLAGYVKLASPDSAWTDLTALDYHFWTQPIPSSLAWYADQLPHWMKAVGVIFTLLAETAAPLLIFAPRKFRHVGALVMVALQLAIMSTGTYGFFNVLTIALCLALFDDEFFGRFRLVSEQEPRELPKPLAMGWSLIIALAVPLVALTTLLPEPVADAVEPLRTFNQYGLFADMTRERPEILVEWSDDGESWTAYDFAYKPTDVAEPLRWTTFSMPRLDWQMWFAALRGCQRATWLRPFVQRLLEGTPEVHALLEGGPSDPPRFVRMRSFAYTFGGDTTWTRAENGEFCPPFTLSETGELTEMSMTSNESARARAAMVRDQIAGRGVSDEGVLAAMGRVPREYFVPAEVRRYSYADRPLPIGWDQTISQPYIVAFMSELLQVERGSKVLEIGTGSGYQAAILLELGAEVYSIEIVEPLAKQAKFNLEAQGYDANLLHGDGYAGWPSEAPFDRIIVTAAPPELPEALVEQLAPGGRLVVPVGRSWQHLDLVTKDLDGDVTIKRVLSVQFVPMVHGDD